MLTEYKIQMLKTSYEKKNVKYLMNTFYID